jgi:hypothetical protein
MIQILIDMQHMQLAIKKNKSFLLSKLSLLPNAN